MTFYLVKLKVELLSLLSPTALPNCQAQLIAGYHSHCKGHFSCLSRVRRLTNSERNRACFTESTCLYVAYTLHKCKLVKEVIVHLFTVLFSFSHQLSQILATTRQSQLTHQRLFANSLIIHDVQI